MVVIFWKIELTTDGPRQFLQWMPPDLFLVAGVQKSIETLDPTIPLQHQTFSTQSKSRCETKSLNHKVNNFWCFVCMWVMHIACVQCVRTMCTCSQEKSRKRLKRSVFNRNFAVRIMLEQSHCQNIHSQSQNRFFKEFTIFLKIVPKKLPFA